MIEKTKVFLHENKSRIGLFHGFVACIGAVLLSFLTTMQLTHLIFGDYALRIIPAVILTPILMSIYGTWLLFCKTRMEVLMKILSLSLFLICSLFISIKVL